MSRTTESISRPLRFALGVLMAGGLSVGCENAAGDTMRSALHACVVSTAITVPVSFSLCQLKNEDEKRVGVYRVGDAFMGSRILTITNGRVLVGDSEHAAFVANCSSGAPASGGHPASYQPVFDGPLPVLDGTSPQG